VGIGGNEPPEAIVFRVGPHADMLPDPQGIFRAKPESTGTEFRHQTIQVVKVVLRLLRRGLHDGDANRDAADVPRVFSPVRVFSQGAFENAVDFREIERLFEELQRPAGERFFLDHLAGVAAHDGDFRVWRDPPDFLQEFDPVPVGKMNIEKDEIEGIVAKLGERIRGGFDEMGGYVEGYEFPLQGPADQLVVVDDKYFRKRLSGHIIDGSKLNTICKSIPSRKNFFYWR
jgi:hypothetical protein